MRTLEDFRRCFPHAENIVYLDHAATAPLNRPVVDAISAYLQQRHLEKPNNYFDVLPVLERGRERLATLLGCHTGRVEYALNTTSGLNILAQGFPWSPGDRVAVPSCEFPANVQPWLGLRERYGVEVDFIPTDGGCFSIERVANALRPETKVLAVSWVQFLSGFQCDLKALADLAHSNDTLLAVDAIQGLGGLALDVEDAGVDFLASGGQKWMLATQGSAFIYVSEHLQSRLQTTRGWLSGPVDWEDFGAFPDELHLDATRFRQGTLNVIGCVAMDASVGLQLDFGPNWLEQRVLDNARRMRTGLTDIGFELFGSSDKCYASGIVTVEADDPEGIHEHLQSRGVHASLRDRKLRFSPHAYNSKEEIDFVLSTCEDFVRSPVI